MRAATNRWSGNFLLVLPAAVSLSQQADKLLFSMAVEAILDQGCLPIPVLEQSLDLWAEERAGP